jgi:hypothetical protein
MRFYRVHSFVIRLQLSVSLSPSSMSATFTDMLVEAACFHGMLPRRVLRTSTLQGHSLVRTKLNWAWFCCFL